MTKKLEILIVEDTEEFAQAAIEALSEFTDVHRAGTYEEAMAYLGTHTPDGVVTDLFFPSATNWAAHYAQELRGEVLKDATKDTNSDEDYRIGEQLLNLDNLTACKENPSGLKMYEHCRAQDIPVLIASQGDRHFGSLATLRAALHKSKKWIQYARFHVPEKYDVNSDPLPELLAFEGLAGALGCVQGVQDFEYFDGIPSGMRLVGKQDVQYWKALWNGEGLDEHQRRYLACTIYEKVREGGKE